MTGVGCTFYSSSQAKELVVFRFLHSISVLYTPSFLTHVVYALIPPHRRTGHGQSWS
jgi:hypothetical protein